MDRLAAWEPVLLGGVAAGWATAHSEIRLELEAEDPKALEMGLINAGVDYAPAPGNAHAELVAGRGESAVRLVVVTPGQRRNRSRRDEAARLSREALRAVLDTEPSSTLG
jgi:hypothetical protein